MAILGCCLYFLKTYHVRIIAIPGCFLYFWFLVLLVFILLNYVRILVVSDCCSHLSSLDFNSLLENGSAASHFLMYYHVRMILSSGCCSHCRFPVLVLILRKYVRILGISGCCSHLRSLAAMFLLLKLARSVTNLGWPIILQCRWRSDDSSSTHQIPNMSTEENQESSLQLKKCRELLRQAVSVKFRSHDQPESTLEDGIESRSHEACKSLSSSAPDLVIQDKRSTFSGEISSLPSSLSHDGRIDKHAVEPLLPPGLEAAHAKPCLESSSQLMKRLEPLCQTDTVKLAFEEVIDLRSQEASKSFGPGFWFPKESVYFS